MKNQKYKTIVTTINSEKESISIRDSILSKRLSPCIQIVKNVESSYIWNEEIMTEKEEIIFIKTVDRNQKLIIKEIEALHPYENPQIICYNFDILTDKYAEWFLESISDK